MPMHTIGIRELKAHLSRTLRHVQQGARYLVTDHGRVVAELRQPTTEDVSQLTPTEQATLRLAAKGILRVAEGPSSSYKAPGVKLPAGTSKELLDWTRGER